MSVAGDMETDCKHLLFSCNNNNNNNMEILLQQHEARRWHKKYLLFSSWPVHEGLFSYFPGKVSSNKIFQVQTLQLPVNYSCDIVWLTRPVRCQVHLWCGLCFEPCTQNQPRIYHFRGQRRVQTQRQWADCPLSNFNGGLYPVMLWS